MCGADDCCGDVAFGVQVARGGYAYARRQAELCGIEQGPRRLRGIRGARHRLPGSGLRLSLTLSLSLSLTLTLALTLTLTLPGGGRTHGCRARLAAKGALQLPPCGEPVRRGALRGLEP
eukprot:scaffold52996_cov46-Phaeocystis_antarctica.AAC.1